LSGSHGSALDWTWPKGIFQADERTREKKGVEVQFPGVKENLEELKAGVESRQEVKMDSH
jgi:hypothetical protein